MSLRSWKDEFYPVNDINSTVKALEHSVLKWTGLLPENLGKHGVLKADHYVCEQGPGQGSYRGSRLGMCATTCALCELFLDDGGDEADSVMCPDCPLVRSGHASCLLSDPTGESDENHYMHWIVYGDAKPMLDALVSALNWWRANHSTTDKKEQTDESGDLES